MKTIRKRLTVFLLAVALGAIPSARVRAETAVVQQAVHSGTELLGLPGLGILCALGLLGLLSYSGGGDDNG